MAEEQEVVIIEEDSKQQDENKEPQQEAQNDKKDKKKLLLIVVAILIFIVILLLVLLLVVVKKKKEKKNSPQTQIEKITKKLKQKHIQTSAIDEVVKKANILFEEGKHQEALKLLNKLSIFSESLSNYNLGVLQIKEKNYKKAIYYFNKAIANQDNRCISAINAAYCSLKLKDKKRFNYYIHLAQLYLPETTNLKGYPYYYALVHYYLGEEFEALAGANKSKSYIESTNKLKTAIYNLYDDPYNTLNFAKDNFILGIEYARIKEYNLAKEYLQKAKEIYPLKASTALGLVNLKLNEYKEAALNLEKARLKDDVVYPIEVFLRKDIFDIKKAQESFKEEAFNKDTFYSILFYYAPYKVFDVAETLRYLHKGSLAISFDDIVESKKYLIKSSTISRLNVKMSEGIRYALTYHITLANKIFAKLAKKYKYHSILQYDLALTYANLKDYNKAYVHFLKAYHLDSNNYLAGIFAIITGKKIGIKDKFLDVIKAQLTGDIDLTKKENKKYLALISYIDNNYADTLSFTESEHKITKFNLALDLAILYNLNKDAFKQKAILLYNLAKKDVIANLLYFYATHNTDNMEKFAFAFQKVFSKSLNEWNLDSVYYGPLIAAELYMKFAKMSGQLIHVKEKFEKQILSNSNDLIPLLKNLAFAALFSKDFEESYTIFNDLIDNKYQDDSKTLFYGAVASIAANHHANAIALLALAKAKNKSNYEARYGLGLLYHEAKNLRGAVIEYDKIPTGFKSQYFDFNVKP